MEFNPQMPEETAQKIADAVGARLRGLFDDSLVIDLPEHIGNAAHAFDCEQGWTVKYNELHEA
jgi:hypothetical protein